MRPAELPLRCLAAFAALLASSAPAGALQPRASATADRPTPAAGRPAATEAVATPIERPVRFRSGALSLSGTLHLPAGRGPFPGVVLVHGAGPGRHDGWPYLQHARSLSATGIAVLVWDKRGVGDSEGEYREALPFDTLAADAAAAIAELRRHPAVDPRRVGVWGRSQGAWVAPLVAARDTQVAFVVAVVGGGVTSLEQNLFQREVRMRLAGAPDEAIARMRRTLEAVWSYLRTAEGRDGAQALVDTLVGMPWFAQARELLAGVPRTGVLPPPEWVRANTATELQWFTREHPFDPEPLLRRLRVPVLGLLAGRDVLTPTEPTRRRMSAALEATGNRASRVVVFPEADHLMCTARPDARHEVGCAFVEGYEREMAEWMRAVTSPRPRPTRP